MPLTLSAVSYFLADSKLANQKAEEFSYGHLSLAAGGTLLSSVPIPKQTQASFQWKLLFRFVVIRRLNP